MVKKLTSKENDYSKWYNELILMADLAENSNVRGCMVIKPYGYAIWEKIQSELDKKFKETGHLNAYFPLFIPKSFFSKEASHIDGFAKECAVVTHYRLKKDDKSDKIVVDENSKLDEELIVRPTSETIIWDSFRKWIQSYRDLPILLNQWANVVRWEMRTRLFLRTSEFLWQEGHTAHESKNEALEESRKICDLYADFVEKFMAIPVIKGTKSESERFAGAVETFCIEALMQDGKALQAGTSHFLGQNFAKAFDVKFQKKDGSTDYVWATSWGVSTRLMGALVMTHSDDKGLVLPPNLAPWQVVIVPVFKSDEEFNHIDKIAKEIKEKLIKNGVRVKYDDNKNYKPGWKFNQYELKGVPLRITLGPRDISKNLIEIFRRDNFEKIYINIDNFEEIIKNLLSEIQNNLFQNAQKFRDSNITKVDDFKTFEKLLKSKGGFFSCHWDGTKQTEELIKQKLKATIRCIPIDSKLEIGKCILTGLPSKKRVLFAKSY
ncbi:MAG: proline--tRNA ligase [Flavobacteriales bacterium]|nr:proline--tRNA ligase [Flavobacteriales bacterium]|tara:strand:- start:1422 stop:2897 length:1476 start_codon:yes stop_codon:yes gene_type:complete